MKSPNVLGLSASLPSFVPAPALLRAAAHMRDRVDEAAIDQRQAIGREARVDRHGHRRHSRRSAAAPCRRAARRGDRAARSARSRHRRRGRRPSASHRPTASKSFGVICFLRSMRWRSAHVVVVDLLAARHRGEAEAEHRRIEFVDQSRSGDNRSAPRRRSRAPRRSRVRGRRGAACRPRAPAATRKSLNSAALSISRPS